MSTNHSSGGSPLKFIAKQVRACQVQPLLLLRVPSFQQPWNWLEGVPQTEEAFQKPPIASLHDFLEGAHPRLFLFPNQEPCRLPKSYRRPWLKSLSPVLASQIGVAGHLTGLDRLLRMPKRQVVLLCLEAWCPFSAFKRIQHGNRSQFGGVPTSAFSLTEL